MATPSPRWLTDDESVRQNRDALIVPLEKLIPAPWNARQNYPTDTLRDLGVSLANEGVIHPLLVRPYGQNYEIVAGHRRYLAAQFQGMTELPVNVKRGISDAQAKLLSFMENLQRESVSPANMLAVLTDLEQMAGGRSALAKELHRDVTWISYQITTLSDEVAAPELLDGTITIKQGVEIARAQSPALKQELLEMALRGVGGDRLRAARFAAEPPEERKPAGGERSEPATLSVEPFNRRAVTPMRVMESAPLPRPVEVATPPLALVPAPGPDVGAVVDELRRLVDRLVPLLAEASVEERAEVATLAAALGEAARAEVA